MKSPRSALSVALSALAVLAITILLLIMRPSASRQMGLVQLVSERGPPSFLAQGTQIAELQVKTLRMRILKLDPLSITNWGSVSNVIAIWPSSERCKAEARFIYNDIRSNRFDGGAWYSSRSPFGEKILMIKIDEKCYVSEVKKVRVDALSVDVVGIRTDKLTPGSPNRVTGQ